MTVRTTALAAVAVAGLLAGTANALTITDDMDATPGGGVLGANNVYPWTSVVFGGTSMAASGGVLTMATSSSAGVWFGNGSLIGQNPGWSLADNTAGNYISLDLRLASSATEDWSLYFYDATGWYAGIVFNPAGDYANPTQYGFEYVYGSGGTAASTLVPFDLDSDFHQFEVLLKGGQVQYAVDGQLVFGGDAHFGGSSNLLVIGDGSGPTPTGTGAMLVDRVRFEAGTERLAIVPVPGAAVLLASALGLLAGVRRRTTSA